MPRGDYGGKAVDAALDEFQRDIFIHASTGFKDLRWIISKDVKVYRDVILESMYDTLKKNREAVEAAGHRFADIETAFFKSANPTSGWLVEFF